MTGANLEAVTRWMTEARWEQAHAVLRSQPPHPTVTDARPTRAAGAPVTGPSIPPGPLGDKPDRYLFDITRIYRTRFTPEHAFTVYRPAPFKTVRGYVYGPDGRLRPATDTR
ncbi:hypothetical protein ACFFHU_09060 [Plantactinospora siamensis]|uniref:Uncharacterized protein n=2 Tax=Plantactinospora siamensis TaxID=555372 RepID=A0ABV6NU59_9ACTN